MTTLVELMGRHPEIKWREPLKIQSLGSPVTYYCCRICLANHGLHGHQVSSLPTDPSVIVRHIEMEHAS